jgi:hypothetical protein
MQPNPAHASWQMQYSAAQAAAAWATSHAEDVVHDLNDAIIPMVEALTRAGYEGEYMQVSDQIDWFLGSYISWGFWSYDGSQVDGIQRDITELKQKLAPIHAEVDPDYDVLHDFVWTAIENRTQELAELPDAPADVPAT